jgi:cell division protein FtsZ
MADSIISTAVKGVAEIITVHGNVNIDYADVFTVMHKSKVFIMGTGYASGEGRAMEAVNLALQSPLLDSNDILGTKNILLNIISGKEEIRMGEIGEIIEKLQEKAGKDADIIWGNGYDESLEDKVCVTILATGFKQNPNQELQPKTEPEKFDLEERTEPEKVEIETTTVSNFQQDVEQVQESLFPLEEEDENEFESIENEPEIFKVKQRSVQEKAKKEKKSRASRRKEKENEPVPESNVDNWFYKKFNKFFTEGEDHSMEQ